MINFGNTLKALRLNGNMTQAQLAQKLGLTKSEISVYETGLSLPSYDVLRYLMLAQIVCLEWSKSRKLTYQACHRLK